MKFETHDAVMLCFGVDEGNNNFYAYVRADRASAERMHKDYETGNTVDFSDYGEILYWDLGDEPPEDIRRLMQAQYGAD